VIHVYHSNTSNGRFAAYVVWRAHTGKEPIEFIEADSDVLVIDPSALSGEDTIYIIDLTYSLHAFNKLAAVVKKIVFISQTNVANNVLDKKIHPVIDCERGVALAAWEYFFDLSNIPEVCRIISDYHTCKWRREQGDYLEAWLQKENISHEWYRWNQLCRHPDVLPNAIEEGKLLLQQKETTQ
jgi:hypothetical protein